MDTKKLISAIGGPAQVGRALRISSQAVSLWVARGRVPAGRLPSLIRLAKVKGLTVAPESIRSDVDWEALK
jgi:DNA-binding transcriptional regulator YdaS (Cro superfamily)